MRYAAETGVGGSCQGADGWGGGVVEDMHKQRKQLRTEKKTRSTPPFWKNSSASAYRLHIRKKK